MKVCLEYLYHYCCDRCKKWWTIADLAPKIGDSIHCPHCLATSVVESVDRSNLPE